MPDEIIAKRFEIITAAVQRIDLGLIDIEPDDRHAGFKESAEQRQTDITQADHADCGCVILDFASQGRHRVLRFF